MDDDRPITPQGSGDINKAIPKDSLYKSQDLLQKDVTNLGKYSRVSTPKRKYVDTASIVRNTFGQWIQKPSKDIFIV